MGKHIFVQTPFGRRETLQKINKSANHKQAKLLNARHLSLAGVTTALDKNWMLRGPIPAPVEGLDNNGACQMALKNLHPLNRARNSINHKLARLSIHAKAKLIKNCDRVEASQWNQISFEWQIYELRCVFRLIDSSTNDNSLGSAAESSRSSHTDFFPACEKLLLTSVVSLGIV